MSDSKNDDLLDETSSHLKKPLLENADFQNYHSLSRNIESDTHAREDSPAVSFFQVSKKIMALGIPMALSYTFTASMVATAMMITRLKQESSDDYLATATLVTTMTNITSCIAISPLLAMSIIGSEKYGELLRFLSVNNEAQAVKGKKEIATLFKNGIVLSTIILPFPFATLFFSEYLLSNWFAQNHQISYLAQQNLRAYSYAIPGLMYRVCIEQILFSFEKSRHTMVMGLTTFGIGTAFSYYFAFGPPNLGLPGIAYGYVIESYLTCAVFGGYMAFHKSFKGIPFLRSEWFNEGLSQQNKALLKMGLPITLQMTCELSAMLLIGFFAGWLSENSLAAQNFSTQLFTFAVIPSDSFAQTLAQEVSRLIGKNNFRDASLFARYGLLTNVGLISLICIPISISPQILTSIYASSVNSNVMKMAKYLIPLAAGQTLAETAGLSMTQTLRSANDLYKPTVIKISLLWLGVLTGYLLGFKTDLGIYGVNLGFLLGVAIGTAALLPRWAVKTKKDYLENTRPSQIPQTLFNVVQAAGGTAAQNLEEGLSMQHK